MCIVYKTIRKFSHKRTRKTTQIIHLNQVPCKKKELKCLLNMHVSMANKEQCVFNKGHFKELVLVAKQGIIGWAKSNTQTIMEVAESLWHIIRTNLSMIMTFTGEILSLVLSGGQACVEFILDMVSFKKIFEIYKYFLIFFFYFFIRLSSLPPYSTYYRVVKLNMLPYK